MCLVAFAWKVHPLFPLILVANRDEFHTRQALPAHFWENAPEVFAGRDLKSGGTWLGVTTSGSLAFVTNYRQPGSSSPGSRGKLVVEALHWTDPPADLYQRFGYFNLVQGTLKQLFVHAHPACQSQALEPGCHVLSNAVLNTMWPKCERLIQRFSDLARREEIEPDPYLTLMSDRTVPPDTQLPKTGVPLEWERILAPAFVLSPTYGTRVSTFLRIDWHGSALFVEQSWTPEGQQGHRIERVLNIAAV